MNTRTTKFISVLLAAVMVFLLMPLGAFGSDIVQRGECGEDLRWYLVVGGLLNITGTGDMQDYSSGESPLYNNNKINEIRIHEEGVTSIGSHAFENCKALKSIIIPDSVTSIGEGAFEGCNSLKDVYYLGTKEQWDNVQVSDGNDPLAAADIHFGEAPAIASGTCGDNLTWTVDVLGRLTISGTGDMYDSSDYSLFGGYAIQKVVIKDGVTSIGEGAFENIEGITDVYYTGTKDQWNEVHIGEHNDILNYAIIHCTDGDVIYIVDSGNCGDNLTWTLSGNGVLTVSGTGDMSGFDRSFDSSYHPLRTVVIEDGVTSICSGAFSACRRLTSITIPDSVTSIGNNAFSGCRGLTSVTIPDGVTSIGNNAFSGCRGLTSVTIPDGVTSIGNDAFYYCSGLINITIPDSVTSIGDRAFSDCSGLTSVTIPDSVTSIGSDAFYGTAWFDNQPNGVVYGGKVAYKYKGEMPSDTTIVLKDGTVGIGGNAFSGCRWLTSVTIPDGVTSIGYCAFFGCSGLTSVTIPNSVTSIDSSAFSGCTGLTSIIIPDSFTSIGIGAFIGCSGITSITIPDSVKSIGWSAFEGCTGLTDVYYSGTEEQWNAIEIGEDNDRLTNAKIHFGELPSVEDTTAPTIDETTKPAPVTTETPVPSIPATTDASAGFRSADDSKAKVDGEKKQVKALPGTASEISALLGDGVRIVDKEGKETAADKPVGTGAKVVLPDGTEYVVIVPLDNNGDGKVNSTDARNALRMAAKLDPLEGAYFTAGDSDGNGKINSSDARKALRAAAKLDVISLG